MLFIQFSNQYLLTHTHTHTLQEVFVISDSLDKEKTRAEEGRVEANEEEGTCKQQLLRMAGIKKSWAGTVRQHSPSHRYSCPHLSFPCSHVLSSYMYFLPFLSLQSFYAHQGECQLLGDLMVLLRAVGAFECSSNKEIFCKRHCLRLKALLEIRKLRQQLTNIGMCVCMCVRTVC